MNDRIETLEDLNEWLSPDYTFSIGWKHAKNTPEKLAWHLLEDLPFDLDIILKGTREWNDGIEREAMDTVEKLDERYGDAFSFDNKELSYWLFSTPLENLAAYTARVIRRQEVNKVSNYYDAAQDHYADYWHEWDEYEDKQITAREFITALKEHIDEVNSKEILKEALHQLPDRPYIWSEFGKRIYAPNMLKYAAMRLNEVGVDIGLGTVYTTEQGYLLDYFSRLYWREAASRPED